MGRSRDESRQDQIQDAIFKNIAGLYDAAHQYCELSSRFAPSHKQICVSIRSAPEDTTISEVLHFRDQVSLCGISTHPEYFNYSEEVGQGASNHERLKAFQYKEAISSEIDQLRNILCEVPILGHGALQIDFIYKLQAGSTQPHSQISIDGISLQAGLKEIRDDAMCIASHLASLCIISNQYEVDKNADWPIYKTQGHIVRAPGPGLAWLKLQAMIQRRPITQDGLASLLKQDLSEVSRLEPRSQILDDLRPRGDRVIKLPISA